MLRDKFDRCRAFDQVSLGLFAIWALFAVMAALVLRTVVPAPFDETVLTYTKLTLQAKSWDDSWRPMKLALDYIHAGGANPIYSEIFFSQGVKFQYPPTALFVEMAAQAIHEVTGRSIYGLISWLSIAVLIVASSKIVVYRLRAEGVEAASRTSSVFQFCVVAALVFTFYPIVKAYTLGQIQLWLDSLFAVALLCWITGRRVASGVSLGLICLIKPPLAIFVLWGLVRREWRFCIALVGTGAVGLLASTLYFGLEAHFDYLKVLSFISARGEAYYPNQTFNGLLNRLVSLSDPVNYNNLTWREAFPPVNTMVRYGTLLTSVGIAAIALAPRSGIADPDRVFDFSSMAIASTMASPIAWEHHYGVALPIFLVTFVALRRSPTYLAMALLSFFLITQFLPITNMLAATPLNFVQSYGLLGGLILFGVLQALRVGVPSPARSAGSTVSGDLGAVVDQG